MFILGKILSTLPLDMIIASLNRVVGPCVEELRSLATLAKSAETKHLIITRLKMIATLCTTLDLRVSSEEPEGEDETSHQVPLTVNQQPVLLIAQQLLPFLQGVVDRWGSDDDINEVPHYSTYLFLLMNAFYFIHIYLLECFYVSIIGINFILNKLLASRSAWW